MNMQYHMIGERQFLQLGRFSIPVDSIITIDFDAPNGESQDCVCIRASGGSEGVYHYNYANADALRAFLGAPSLEDIRRGSSSGIS